MESLGFTTIQSRFVPEARATMDVLIHDETGLRVIKFHPENPAHTECNALLAFATPPEDDKGIPHILEHSVFCGSTRFPHHEPFTVVTSSSLQTYANAYTAQMHTGYNFSSNCEADYLNILDIYVDAIFRPLILEDERIYGQEGWHLHVDENTGMLDERGVVLGEMKGHFSSPTSLANFHAQRLLFGDTAPGFESGGLPAAIIQGTHADMLNFYNKHYTPGNCVVVFYGPIALEKELEHLLPYLTATKRVSPIQIPLVAPKSLNEPLTIPYSSEEDEDAGILCRGYHLFNLCDATPTLLLAFRVLDYILFDQSSSPIPDTLEKAHLCKSCYSQLHIEDAQCALYVTCMGCDPTEQGVTLLCSALTETLEGLALGDINPTFASYLSLEALSAALNKIEFTLREIDSDFGIKVADSTAFAIIAGLEPDFLLCYEDALKELREMIAAGTASTYFRNLVLKYLSGLSRSVDVVLIPEPELAERRGEENEIRLSAIRDTLSEKELRELALRAHDIESRQQVEEPKEVLDSFPVLTRDDIAGLERHVLDARCHLTKTNIPIAHYNTGSLGAGVCYLKVCLDVTSFCTPTNIHLLSFIANALLGESPTNSFPTVDKLHREVNACTGDLDVSLIIRKRRAFETFADKKLVGTARAFVEVTTKCLEAEYERVLRLVIEEILYGSLPGLVDQKHLLRLMRQYQSDLREDLLSNSTHTVASSKAQASQGDVAAYLRELTMGPTMHGWLTSQLVLIDGDSSSDDEGEAEEIVCCSDDLETCEDTHGPAEELDVLGSHLTELWKNILSHASLLVVIGHNVPALAPYADKLCITAADRAIIQNILTTDPLTLVTGRILTPFARPQINTWISRRSNLPIYPQFQALLSQAEDDIYRPALQSVALPIEVNYIARAIPASPTLLPAALDGPHLLLDHYLNNVYLWDKVRVEGGAYGCIASCNRDGSMYIVSYRDPQVLRTIAVYDDLENHCRSEPFASLGSNELFRLKIGCLGGEQLPMGPEHRFSHAFDMFLRERDPSESYHALRKMLRTTATELQKVYETYSSISAGSTIVIGPEESCRTALDNGKISFYDTFDQ
ncbi:Metalloendopeptidase [Giardia muris]|uniref:Metalloendopeptidase n=1 Tax=Giardia muris TaxID=5742 RepID=A0A4Z1TAY5_GIAMU|nr:Metalloendopeptidase [Giardia muris]|eukprot:TNJ29681.1 Metalloendopeptidase [Giardia muris]